MINFTLELARINVSAAVNFESTKNDCAGYLTDGAPDITLTILPEDVEREREKSTIDCSDEQLEYLALNRKIADALSSRGVILFHASAVAADGEGFLFTAPSGTGKSTHASLWRKLLGDRVVTINDDKPFVGCVGGEFTVFGSPWNGKHRLGANVSAPIRGICFLSRGKDNEIKRISPDEALPLLLMQTYRPADADITALIFQTLIKMAQTVPVYKMKCNMDVSAAKTSYDEMKGKKNET